MYDKEIHNVRKLQLRELVGYYFSFRYLRGLVGYYFSFRYTGRRTSYSFCCDFRGVSCNYVLRKRQISHKFLGLHNPNGNQLQSYVADDCAVYV